MEQKYTKEERKEYYTNLRERWKKNKLDAEQDIDARKKFEAIQKEAESKISYYSFYFTLQEMIKNGFTGNPYIDTKTFQGWRKVGFKVKKGEKSKIKGISWVDVSKNEDKEIVIPKIYSLFHNSQVEKI